MKTCANPKCDQTFEIKNGHYQRFCSRACKRKVNHFEWKDKQMRGISTKRTVKKLACLKCGKQITSRTKNQMCKPCLYTSGHQEVDDTVFGAIVEFKRAQDGTSPKGEEVAEMIHFSRETVAKSIRRLERTGRITRKKTSRSRVQILVPGGQWVYEGRDNGH